MAENGIKTTNLAALSRFDSLVGNSDGSTVLIPFADVARQMAGLGIDGLDEWLLAQKWAENAEDDPVVPGQFSALHHAAKAADSALAAADDLLLVQGARDDAIELINITGPVQVVETIADRDALTGLSADDVVEVLAERARYVWDGAAFGAAYSLSPASEAATIEEIRDDILAAEAAIAAAQVHKLTKDTGLGLDTGSAQIDGLTDLDTLFRAGVYAFSSASVTNLPPSGADPGFIVTVTGYDANSIRQSAINIRDNNLWHRWYQGVWSDWEVVGAPFATQAEAEAGTDNTRLMTSLGTSQAIAAQASGAPSFVLEDHRGATENGDTGTGGISAFRTRTLQTISKGGAAEVVLAANEFTPQSDCWVQWWAHIKSTNEFIVRLWNVTDDVQAGGMANGYVSSGFTDRGVGTGDLIAGKTYRLEWATAGNQSTSGGRAPGGTGSVIYAQVVGWF